MAKPNYQFEKRQRELAKKRKKEEKAQRKAGSPAEPEQAADVPQSGSTSPAPTDPGRT